MNRENRPRPALPGKRPENGGRNLPAGSRREDSAITERKLDAFQPKTRRLLPVIRGVDPDGILRALVSAGLLIFFALLQTTIFARFRPFGAVPDLMLPLVIAVGMTEREKWGAVFGIAAAFVIESLGGAEISLLSLLYMPAGYLAGVLTIEMFRDSPAVRLLYTAVGCAAHMIFTLLAIGWTMEGFSFGVAMTRSVLPEFLASMVFAPLPHLLAKASLRVFHRPREEKVE